MVRGLIGGEYRMRPTLTTLTRLIVAGIVILAGWGSSVTAWTATDDPSPVAARTAQTAPSQPDNPLREPQQWVSRNGYLRVRLVTEVRQVQLGGRSVRALV